MFSTPEFVIGALLFIVLASIAACYWLARKATDEPEPAYRVRFDVDPLAPEPFVDAVAAPLPLEDAEQLKCKLCGAPLSSLTSNHCWVCTSPNDRSAA